MPRSGFAKDSVEVEGYVRGFARRRPDVAVTMLRFANFLGPQRATRRSRRTSRCRSCRPSSATTRGCSSSTRTTGSRCCGARRVERPRAARSTSPATACCCSRRPSGGRPAVAAAAAARRAPWIGQALRPARAGRLLAGADPAPDLRPGRGHQPDARGARLRSRATPPREAFDDFVARQRLHGPLSADVVGASRQGRRRPVVARRPEPVPCLTPG